MPSASSISLTSSEISLDERARAILGHLCNEHNYSSAAELIHPAVTIQHDDDEPHTSRSAFLQTWQAASLSMPDMQMVIQEAIVDGDQRKVWVRSELRGLSGGVVKDSIDMMTFDEEGLLIRSEDCQRVKRRV